MYFKLVSSKIVPILSSKYVYFLHFLLILEGTRAAGSYKGSNTSINSVSSLNSTKSSIDNAPIFFSTTGSSVSSVDDESFTSISVSNGYVSGCIYIYIQQSCLFNEVWFFACCCLPTPPCLLGVVRFCCFMGDLPPVI